MQKKVTYRLEAVQIILICSYSGCDDGSSGMRLSLVALARAAG